MNQGKVSYAEQDGNCVIRCEGVINYTLGPALDRFLDELFARGECRGIIVDLTHVDSIDSTGLGLLARIAKYQRQRDGSKPLMFSVHQDVNTVLKSICLDEVFVLLEQTPIAVEGRTLTPGNPSETELARTILEAHRLLSELNENNRAMFRDVVEAFERDLGQR
ncbi:STAS domain-containing protein [Propionivibrio soli]|uniref:STAS domain-containing protein n=1 Tax=Propionivibrio soli TaxID=2976531 RepID=UPI0021E93D88|nr:STAS domain-containing protein [Propionivibrio soli]